MDMWFKKYETAKWHLARYGGSIAQCGRDVHIGSIYASFTTSTTCDEVESNPLYCQSCVNSVMCFRKLSRKLDKGRLER